MSRYQVVAECAFATVNTVQGRFQTLLYKGALVPDDAPELERLIGSGHVAKVGDEVTGGVNADGVPDGGLDGSVHEGLTTTPVEKSEEQVKAEREAAEKSAKERAGREKADAEAAELAEKRAAAKAKLPADKSAPDGRASQAVWVEYLVSKGSRYEDVKDADKDELIKLAKQQQS